MGREGQRDGAANHGPGGRRRCTARRRRRCGAAAGVRGMPPLSQHLPDLRRRRTHQRQLRLVRPCLRRRSAGARRGGRTRRRTRSGRLSSGRSIGPLVGRRADPTPTLNRPATSVALVPEAALRGRTVRRRGGCRDTCIHRQRCRVPLCARAPVAGRTDADGGAARAPASCVHGSRKDPRGSRATSPRAN